MAKSATGSKRSATSSTTDKEAVGAATFRHDVRKYFVPILYQNPAFDAFDDFSDFVESISCETSKSCQVRGSNPCQTDQDRLGVDQKVHLGFPCGRTRLRQRFASPTSKPPTQLPTHFPFSSIVRPATPSTPGGVWPRFTAGWHSGSARTRRSSGPKPARESQLRCQPAAVCATGACELDRKTTIPAHTAADDRRHCRMHAKQIAPRTFFGLEPPIERKQPLLIQLC
jgi:hypothetical protein